MAKPKKKLVVKVPEQNENESSPTSEQPLPPNTGNESLNTFPPPLTTESPVSFPPPVEAMTQSPPPSETAGSQSSLKSTRSSQSQKTEEQSSPKQKLETPPKEDPIQGSEGYEYLQWAAENLGDEDFKARYTARARHLADLYQGRKGNETLLERLSNL